MDEGKLADLAAAIRAAADARRDTLPATPPPIDEILLRRALSGSDLAFAWFHLGWGGFARRWCVQVRAFAAVMIAARRNQRAVLSRRVNAQDADAERVLADEIRFYRLWLGLWLHGAAHFAGFPRPDRMQAAYAELRPLAYRRARVLSLSPAA